MTRITLLALSVLLAASPALAADWQTFTPCRLAGNASNDGDSFHVQCPDGEERIFRLYFVDAPESDDSFPDRVAEQAKYFGISPQQALEIGKAALELTGKVLTEPFAVQTKLSSALGRSSLPRHYAIVTTRDGVDLAAMLVSNGLARVFGEGVTLRDGTPSNTQRDVLLLAELYAKRNRLGAWSLSEPEEQAFPVMVLQKDAMLHTDSDPPRPITRVRVRERLLFLERLSDEWVRVAYGLSFKSMGRCRWKEVKTALSEGEIARRKYEKMIRARETALETLRNTMDDESPGYMPPPIRHSSSQ